MDPLIGGLISGGASLLGSFFSSDTSAKNTQAQIAANQQMVMQQEQFQEKMSNTAYQRASADMKAAGLNPMMMFGSGGPASTPGGASIPQTVNRTSPFANFGDTVSKAVGTAVSMKTMDKMTEEIANIVADERLKRVEATVGAERAGQIRQETQTETERTGIAAAQKTVEQNAATTARNLMDMDPAYRAVVERAAKYGTDTSKAIAPATDVLSSAMGARRTFHDIWRDRIDRGY